MLEIIEDMAYLQHWDAQFIVNTGKPPHGFIGQQLSWLASGLSGRMTGWLAGRLSDWLVGELAGGGRWRGAEI